MLNAEQKRAVIACLLQMGDPYLLITRSPGTFPCESHADQKAFEDQIEAFTNQIAEHFAEPDPRLTEEQRDTIVAWMTTYNVKGLLEDECETFPDDSPEIRDAITSYMDKLWKWVSL